jgi:hypothetical protein
VTTPKGWREPVAPCVQLSVLYLDNITHYFPANGGWKVDATIRCIVIGRGMPRTYVPLDTVRSFTVEDIPPVTTEHEEDF